MNTKTYANWNELDAEYKVYTGATDSASVDEEIGLGEDGVLFTVCDLLDEEGESAGTVIVDFISTDGQMVAYIFQGAETEDEARAFARKLIEPWKTRDDFSATWYFEDED